MLKISIVTDSACDLPRKFIKEHNIHVVPHQVMLNGETYKLGIDINAADYYAELEKLEYIPKSTTPSAQDFYECFKNSLDAGYEHVIYVSVSSHLTSTLQIGQLAAKKFPEKVSCIDSFAASGVQGLLIMAILHMIEKNYDLEKILSEIENLRTRAILVVGFYTLDNVYKSGRLKSKMLLKLTKFLKIKPVAKMLIPPGVLKSRFPGIISGKHMEKRLVQLVIKSIDKKQDYNVIVSHVDNEKGSQRVIKQLGMQMGIKEAYITTASPIIGTNTGKYTIIVSLLPKVE